MAANAFYNPNFAASGMTGSRPFGISSIPANDIINGILNIGGNFAPAGVGAGLSFAKGAYQSLANGTEANTNGLSTVQNALYGPGFGERAASWLAGLFGSGASPNPANGQFQTSRPTNNLAGLTAGNPIAPNGTTVQMPSTVTGGTTGGQPDLMARLAAILGFGPSSQAGKIDLGFGGGGPIAATVEGNMFGSSGGTSGNFDVTGGWTGPMGINIPLVGGQVSQAGKSG